MAIWMMAIFFLLKVVAGIAYGWLHQKFYGGGDTALFFNGGNLIYTKLFTDPVLYFKLVFLPHGDPPAHLKDFAYQLHYWDSPSQFALLRINALFRIFSFGYYSIHVVFWSFFSTIGLLGIFNTFKHYYPSIKQALIPLFFLVPSVVFWSSGVHKGGICLFCIGVLLNSLSTLVHVKKRFIHILLWISLLFLLGLVRNYAFLLFLPPLVAFVWAEKKRKSSFLKFVAVYSIFIAFMLILRQVSPALDFIAMLAEVQHLFINFYIGNSDVQVVTLEPNIWSVLSAFPQALYNVVFRPHLGDMHNQLSIMPAIETTFILGFALVAIIFNRFKDISNRNFLYFCFFYVLSYFILVGLTIDNLGAIVRYRSVVYPLYLGGLAVLVDWEKLKRFLKIKTD